jgi:hypothetical protein
MLLGSEYNYLEISYQYLNQTAHVGVSARVRVCLRARVLACIGSKDIYCILRHAT